MMDKDSFKFLSLLTHTRGGKGNIYCEKRNYSGNSFVDEASDEDIDWLADYPKVHYVYNVAEVAFLIHKLNQCARRFKEAQIELNLRKLKKREKKLNKISDNVEKSLTLFYHMEKEKERKERSRSKKRRLFGEHARAAVCYDKNNFEEFRAVRIKLVNQFDEVCAEEVENIRKLFSAFIEDSFKSWERQKFETSNIT
jgi:hypothetical protein